MGADINATTLPECCSLQVHFISPERNANKTHTVPDSCEAHVKEEQQQDTSHVQGHGKLENGKGYEAWNPE